MSQDEMRKTISYHQKKHLAVAQRQSDLTKLMLQTRRRLSSDPLIEKNKYSATDELSSTSHVT